MKKIACTQIILLLFFLFSECSGEIKGDLILTSTSPHGVHTVEAYRYGGGATTAFAIDVYLVVGNERKKIYSRYRDYDADITWKNDNVIEINGITLDLSKNETYDE